MLKTAPINLRALEAQKRLIDYAADLLGKTRSDFILEASCSVAENAILDKTFFPLSDEQYQKFVELLEQPTAEHSEYKKLMAMKPVWED